MKFPFLNRFKRQKDKPGRTLGEVVLRPNISPTDASILAEINRQMLAMSGGARQIAALQPTREQKAIDRYNDTACDRLVRMYDAAVTTNLNADFPVSITSANAEILVSLMAARSRSRRLERDNSYMWSILQAYQKGVGGDDPFRLEMNVGKWSKTGDSQEPEWVKETDTNRIIEEAWAEECLPENCCTRRDMSRLELDLMTITAIVRDGGVLFRHWPGYPHNGFKYALEPIEIDRLDHYWQRPQTKGDANEIQFSIEMDEYHAPIAYHILTRHPGDVYAYSNTPKYRERVPAERVILISDIRTRASQYVAMPRTTSTIQHLHRVDQFDICHMTAAIWSSSKPMFFLQKFPTAIEYVPDFVRNAMNSVKEAREQGQQVLDVRPGTAETLPWGVEPWQSDPKFPLETGPEFKKENLRAASAGSGVPYHQVGHDLKEVNFSSARIGEGDWHDSCKIFQRHFILSFRLPHFKYWLRWAMLSRKVPLPLSRYEELCKSATFYGRRWPYIQPMEEAQADILQVQSGFKSRTEVRREHGASNVEELDADIASDRKTDKAHGLDFSSADTTLPKILKGVPGQVTPNPEGQSPSQQAAAAGGKNGKKSRAELDEEVLFAYRRGEFEQ